MTGADLRRGTVLVAILLGVLAVTEPAHAEPYDGRPPDPPSTSNLALWLTRRLVRPAHDVTQHLLRRPLDAVGVALDASGAVNPKTGPSTGPSFTPLFVLDAGRSPQVGLSVSLPGEKGEGTVFRVSALTWGREASELEGRIRLWKGVGEGFASASIGHRKDEIFAGVGPLAPASAVSRYTATRGEVALHSSADSVLAPAVVVGTRLRLSFSHYDDGACCGYTTLGERVLRQELALPPGFSGTTVVGERISLRVQTPGDINTSGAGARAGVEPLFVISSSPGTPLVRWDVELSARLAVGRSRRLGVLAAVTSVETPRGGVVPLAELVSPALPAFLPGRILGQSSAVAGARYEWPIWFLLDGSLGAAVGNSFGSHFSGFAPDLTRGSFDMGIRSSGNSALGFRALVGVGTRPFSEGGRPSDVRLLLELAPRDL